MNDLMTIRMLEASLGRIEDVLKMQLALLQIIKTILSQIANKQGIPTVIIEQILDDTIPMGTNGVQE